MSIEIFYHEVQRFIGDSNLHRKIGEIFTQMAVDKIFEINS